MQTRCTVSTYLRSWYNCNCYKQNKKIIFYILKISCIHGKRGVWILFLNLKILASWPQKGSPDPPPSLFKIIVLHTVLYKINIFLLKLICKASPLQMSFLPVYWPEKSRFAPLRIQRVRVALAGEKLAIILRYDA